MHRLSPLLFVAGQIAKRALIRQVAIDLKNGTRVHGSSEPQVGLLLIDNHQRSDTEEGRMMNAISSNTSDSVFRSLCKAGGIASFVFIIYSLMTIIILAAIGGPPSTASEAFSMLQTNRFLGLLRMDLLTVIFILLYYLIFLGIFLALNGKKNVWAIMALIFVFVGVTLFLATPSVLAMLNLSDKYATATSENQQNQLIAAGEDILASDMWHGTGAILGGILIQCGALIFSILMLPGNVFNKLTAYVGIITHGLDLAHFFFLFLIPPVGVVLLAIAGTLYLLWFPLIGVRLIQIGKQVQV